VRRPLLIAVLALGALGVPGAAAAATPISQSFTTTGEQQFVVPPGVTSVQATLVGGHGAAGDDGAPGGIGATVTATLAVSPGEILYAEVAGNGVPLVEAPGGHIGGYGGGGEGGLRQTFGTLVGGGGGGGASDVRRCSASAPPSGCGTQPSLASRLLVAGGGGGGGGNGESPPSTAGGNGGPADQSGSPGAQDAGVDSGGSPGLRATSTGAGAAGSPSSACEPVGGSGCPTAGALGLGGAGGWGITGGGGGGGGGIFGGGGGGGDQAGAELVDDELVVHGGGGGGGGGGSSGVPAGAAGVSGFSLVPTTEGAQPSVTFTWTPAPPAVVTGTASAVTATTATLNGTVNPDAWQVTSCGFDISPAPAGVSSFPCAQQLTGGGTPTAVSATAAGLAPATTYTITLAASTVQGSSNGSAVTFTTPSTSPGTGPAGTGSPVALTVTDLRLTPTRFRRGTHAATLAKHARKRIPVGTTISFTLSEAATVTLSFQRAQPGQSSGGRCLAPSRTRRHGRHCTRYTTVPGSVSIAAPAGADGLGFDGLLDGGAKLAPSSYRLMLSASDTSGATTAAQRPSFTLLG
jgi:hypothetical protein